MAQALTEGTRSGSSSTEKIMNVVLWVLQIAAAGMFLMAGFSKLSGNAQMVAMFEAIGAGQWFRHLTGALEIVGAILLLIPRTSGLGALMLAGVMAGAVMTHLFIIGGSPLIAITLLVVTGAVARGTKVFLARFVKTAPFRYNLGSGNLSRFDPPSLFSASTTAARRYEP